MTAVGLVTKAQRGASHGGSAGTHKAFEISSKKFRKGPQAAYAVKDDAAGVRRVRSRLSRCLHHGPVVVVAVGIPGSPAPPGPKFDCPHSLRALPEVGAEQPSRSVVHRAVRREVHERSVPTARRVRVEEPPSRRTGKGGCRRSATAHHRHDTFRAGDTRSRLSSAARRQDLYLQLFVWSARPRPRPETAPGKRAAPR